MWKLDREGARGDGREKKLTNHLKKNGNRGRRGNLNERVKNKIDSTTTLLEGEIFEGRTERNLSHMPGKE